MSEPASRCTSPTIEKMQDIEYADEYQEPVQQEVEGEEEEKDNQAENDAEDEAEGDDQEGNVEMSRFIVNYMAHRVYGVPQKFILHEARRNMSVKDGVEIGALLNFRSRPLWNDLMYYHVTMFGGKLVTTGREESAPYVCFEPRDRNDTDDKDWLRSIPTAIMEYKQPIWKKHIKEKYAGDRDKMKRVLKIYEPVLTWKKEQVTGAKLCPSSLGVGSEGMKILKKKPVSCKEKPETQARVSKDSGKVEKIINKSSKKADNASDISSASTAAAHGKATDLGATSDIHVFEANGRWFMVELPSA